MNGDLEIEGDMFTVFNELLKYKGKFSTNFKSLNKIFCGSTSMKKQKEEVSSHYDIGNDFYKIWLDDTLVIHVHISKMKMNHYMMHK